MVCFQSAEKIITRSRDCYLTEAKIIKQTWADVLSHFSYNSAIMSLNDQLKSFKKSLVSQPVYGVKRMAGKPDISQNESRASSTPGTPIANNTKAAYESSMEGKKKNKRSNHGLGTDIIIALSYNKHNGNCLFNSNRCSLFTAS
jgi:hypothetical protein